MLNAKNTCYNSWCKWTKGEMFCLTGPYPAHQWTYTRWSFTPRLAHHTWTHNCTLLTVNLKLALQKSPWVQPMAFKMRNRLYRPLPWPAIALLIHKHRDARTTEEGNGRPLLAPPRALHHGGVQLSKGNWLSILVDIELFIGLSMSLVKGDGGAGHFVVFAVLKLVYLGPFKNTEQGIQVLIHRLVSCLCCHLKVENLHLSIYGSFWYL